MNNAGKIEHFNQTFGPLPIALSVVAGLPYLLIYLKNLWAEAHYQFFPFLVGAVAYLAYKRWGGRYAFPKTWMGWCQRLFAWLVFGGGLFGLLCATVFASPWMGYFGFASCLTALFAYRQDSEAKEKSLIYLGLPVALLWQPPYNSVQTADTILIQQLQLVSARLSSKWLDTLGYLHFQPGTVLEIPGKSFGVAEACSGIQSFFAVLCVAALLVALLRRGLVHSVLLLASSPLWAVLMNTIRITLIPIAYASVGIDLSHGFLHDILGYCTMALAIGLLLSTDELIMAASLWLGSLRKRDRSELKEQRDASSTPLPSSPITQYVALGLGVLFCAPVLGIQGYDAYQSWSIQRNVIDFFRDDSLIEISSRAMTGDLQGWPQVRYNQFNRERGNDDMGQRSDMWYYDAPFGRVSFSFDQMFPGWHELTRCYRNAGWKMTKRHVWQGDEFNDWPVVGVDLSRADEHGYLLFSLVTREGKPIQPPGGFTYWTILQERLRGRLTPAVRGALFGTAAYQQQSFVSTPQPIGSEDKAAMLGRFLEARQTLWSAAQQAIDE